MLPPIVPRFRTCRSPMSRAHSADRGQRRSSQRIGGDQRVPGRQRSHVENLPTDLDAAEVEPGDVHHERRPRDAELHHRDQRLAAGDRLGVGLGEQGQRAIDVRGSLVPDRGRDHDGSSVPERRTGGTHRLDDGLIARAPAEVPAERVADRLDGGVGVAREQVSGGEDDSRRAEAALQAVVLDERALDRVQPAVGRESLDRGDRGAGRLQREHRAALHGAAVEENRARSALARVAADVCARQPEPVSQRMDEQRPALHLERASLAVDIELECFRHRRVARRASRGDMRGTAPGRCSRRR